MKLTTKRNRWYFWRELFSYMIPMILIVGTIDVFFNFMQCPLHPEWSAPCDVNWILAAIYGIFLLIVIILAIISASMLRKVKRKIEIEFLEATTHANKIEEKTKEKSENIKEVKATKTKKVIVKNDKKSDKKGNINKKNIVRKTTKKS